MKRKELSDALFLLNGVNFRDNKKITFPTDSEAKGFLIRYLTLECLSGVTHTKKDILKTEKALKKLLKDNKNSVTDKELPMLEGSKKSFEDVTYLLKGKNVYIKKDPL